MTFSILPGVAILILTFFAPIALAQGPENRGYGVLDPSLTGTRAGYTQDEVTYWAPNDDSYVNPDHFRQQMLDLHNQYRREHGAAAVTWDLNLVRSSQAHVDTCVYAHSPAASNPATLYGENIYFGYENVNSGVTRWGDERNAYAAGGYYTNGKDAPHDCLHFTQMVWRATTAIGCTRKKCVADQLGGGNVQESWFVCCHYSPRGNYQGRYRANVLPQR